MVERGREFSRLMFKWRNQVGSDPNLTRFDFGVAYAISEWVYREDGKVSQTAIANDVRATVRGVQKSIGRLSEHGHLRVEDNSKRGLINRYWPIVRESDHQLDAAVQDANGHSLKSHEARARLPHPVSDPGRGPSPVHQHLHASQSLALGVENDLQVLEQHRPGDLAKRSRLGLG